ncbi:MFS transporter [Actinophytocola sp.]|uniref:MFS transporter n=1 Tax=Actinophytocola sp. TaxID=1872138 RepID=UPI002ED8C275
MVDRLLDRRRLAMAGLHAGAFLGPFGGGVTSAMLPELGADFDVSATTASATITAYLVPFAGLMLFSGTLGARWGLRRSVIGAYLVSIAGSVLCAVSTTFPLLLAGRGVQGVANAFTTPLLIATIAATTPRERLGRSLGLFASLQAAGQTSAPLLGGLAAEASWRLAFVGVAVAAAALAAIGLPPSAESRPAEPARLRAAWRPEVLRAAAVALVGWGCLGGLTFLVAFRTDDGFGLGASARGLLLTAFGVVGMLTAHLVGRLIERTGARPATLAGGVLGAVPIALIGVVPWLPAVAVLWALAGFFAQFIQVGLNALVLTGDNANPAGAVSVVQAFRFVGAALAPVAFTPVYHGSAAAGFLLPAVLLAAVTPLALLVRRR